MKDFSKRLIAWYQINKRDLPWRETTNPYRIWLSEIILQQTRVEQGRSYYEKFITLFPDVFALAAASEDQVLKAWQGLGYYSRARNLHTTAKFIASELRGKFPESAEALVKLKGIGPYTAAAIASFSFGEASPVLDGNVIRVLSRLYALEEPVDSLNSKKKLNDWSRDLIDKTDPATYNQAIMEFGALHCTPVNPKCDHCPFASRCEAFNHELVAVIPVKGKKTKVKDVWFYYFLISDGNSTFIKRRDTEGIWKGLYDFPIVESESDISTNTAIQEFLNSSKMSKKPSVTSISEEFTHLLSHRKIRAQFIEISIHPGAKWKENSVLKIKKNDLKKYGMPRLIEKYLRSRPQWDELWA